MEPDIDAESVTDALAQFRLRVRRSASASASLPSPWWKSGWCSRMSNR
jgi:hypothetical protein